MELENLYSDEKGNTTNSRNCKGKIPTQGTGAEQPVVAKKLLKNGGAKGLYYPVL
jgi:hypothetical protein